MNKYENAVDQLKKGIEIYIDKKTDEITCDKTFTALVTKVNSNGTYAVSLNGVEYNHIKTIGGTCYVNETVKVLVPQNNYNNMFILKAIEDTQGYKMYKFENPNDIVINSSGNIMKEYNFSSQQSFGTQTGKLQILDEYYVTKKEEYRTNSEDGTYFYKKGKEYDEYPLTLTNIQRDAINNVLTYNWNISDFVDFNHTKQGVIDISFNNKQILFIKIKGTIKVTNFDPQNIITVTLNNSDTSHYNTNFINFNKNGAETNFEVYINTISYQEYVPNSKAVFWCLPDTSSRIPDNTSVEIKIKEILGYSGSGHTVNGKGSISNNNGFTSKINEIKLFYFKSDSFSHRTALFCYDGGDSHGVYRSLPYNGKYFSFPISYYETPYVQPFFGISGEESYYTCFPYFYDENPINNDNFLFQISTNIPIFETSKDAHDYIYANDDESALTILTKALNYKETEINNNEIFSTTLLMGENSKAKIDIELLLENILSQGTNYTDFDIYYYVNGVRQARIPKGKLLEGDNIVRLMYVVESDVSARKVFSVLLKPQSGIVSLNTKQELVTITGNGLLDQTFWSGDINIYEYFNKVSPINPDIVSCEDTVDVAIVQRPDVRSYTWGYLKNNFDWQSLFDDYVW